MEEGPRSAFVDLVGLRSGANIDTFTATGDAVGIFKILDINISTDSATIQDSTGAELILDFNFRGIPLDTPFQVLRISPEAAEPVSSNEVEEEPVSGETEEEEEFEELGTISIPVVQQLIEIEQKDRVYPDISQKSDLLIELLSLMDAPSQRNPNILKNLRALVELWNMLKLQTIKSRDDGKVSGEEKLY